MTWKLYPTYIFLLLSVYMVENPPVYPLSLDVFSTTNVQPNQKMHYLLATNHISEMVLPDTFWAV